MADEEKENRFRKYVRTTAHLADVEGDRVTLNQDTLADRSWTEPGAMIKNFTDSVFLQNPPRHRDTGEQKRGHITFSEEDIEVRKSTFYLGEGNDFVVMKDDAKITDNAFHAGFKPGFWNGVDKISDDIKHALGSTSLRAHRDTVVLRGQRDDYQFIFDKDNPNTFKIKHLVSGAENKFENFNYIVFGGPENFWKGASHFVEVAKIKAEAEAKTVTKETRGKITPASVPQPAATHETLDESPQAAERLAQHITQCMEKGQKLEEVLGTLDQQYPGALQTIQDAKPGENLTPKAIAQRIVQECVQGRS